MWPRADGQLALRIEQLHAVLRQHHVDHPDGDVAQEHVHHGFVGGERHVSVITVVWALHQVVDRVDTMDLRDLRRAHNYLAGGMGHEAVGSRLDDLQ